MLHIVNKSPYEKNSLDTCLRLSNDGASILLIEDAVYTAIRESSQAVKLGRALHTKKVFVLSADLAARGIEAGQVLEGVELVDYEGFVDLAVRCGKSQSWL